MALVVVLALVYEFIVFLICDCFCPFYYFIFVKSGIEMQDRNDQWYQHLLTLFAIFYVLRAIPKGLTFGLCLYVYVYVMCMFCIVFNCCECDI